jgi:hypothetical protein
METQELPLFREDGSPAYYLPQAVNADLSSQRLVFLREMRSGPAHPAGLYLAAVSAKATTGESIIRVFLYECFNERVTVLGNLPTDQAEPVLLAFTRPPFIISIGYGVPENYSFAAISYSYNDGTVVEFPMFQQPKDGIIWATTSTVLPEDPSALVAGLSFYKDGVQMQTTDNPVLPPERLYFAFDPMINPHTPAYPDDFDWQPAEAPPTDVRLRFICRDAKLLEIPPELEYLQGSE